MPLTRTSVFLVLMFFLLLPGLSAAAPSAHLGEPPLGDRWFSIAMESDRTGFAHTYMATAPEGYEVRSEGCSRMVVLGFTREAASRETYQVGRDLALKSFAVEQTIGGKQMRLKGEVTAKGIKVAVDAGGKVVGKFLKVRGKVYPPPLLNLYPLMHGATPGKKYHVKMFDPEEVEPKEVTITVIGMETLPGGVETVHLRNDLYPFVDNDIWVDLAGNTVRESIRDGLIVTSVEDAAAAATFIIDAAITRKELILDYSLVRTDRPVARPAELKRMAVELSGMPPDVPLFAGGGQEAVRLAGDRVLFTVERVPLPAGNGPAAAVFVSESTTTVPAGAKPPENDELAVAGNGILGGERKPQVVVEKLVRWIAAEVAESGDTRSPLETFRSRKGNSLSRTRLYVAMASAAGIPTRLVSGLVYVIGKGFLFHCWAESQVGGWVPVDPCRGQVHADVTHVKLAEGDSPEAMAPLAGLIGALKAKVVEETY